VSAANQKRFCSQCKHCYAPLGDYQTWQCLRSEQPDYQRDLLVAGPGREEQVQKHQLCVIERSGGIMSVGCGSYGRFFER
jgi:hypothetical protein